MTDEQTRWQFGDCPMPGQMAMDTDEDEQEGPTDPDDYPY